MLELGPGEPGEPGDPTRDEDEVTLKADGETVLFFSL